MVRVVWLVRRLLLCEGACDVDNSAHLPTASCIGQRTHAPLPLPPPAQACGTKNAWCCPGKVCSGKMLCQKNNKCK